MKKLTKADILNIEPGRFQVFEFDDIKAIVSARSYVLQLSRIEPPQGVARYRTKSDYDNKTLRVEAVPGV